MSQIVKHSRTVPPNEDDPVSLRIAIQQLSAAIRYIADNLYPVTPQIYTLPFSGAGTFVLWNEAAPANFRVVDAWVVKTDANANSIQLYANTTELTGTAPATPQAFAATDRLVTRFTHINDAAHNIVVNKSLSATVTGTGSGIIYIMVYPT